MTPWIKTTIYGQIYCCAVIIQTPESYIYYIFAQHELQLPELWTANKNAAYSFFIWDVGTSSANLCASLTYYITPWRFIVKMNHYKCHLHEACVSRAEWSRALSKRTWLLKSSYMSDCSCVGFHTVTGIFTQLPQLNNILPSQKAQALCYQPIKNIYNFSKSWIFSINHTAETNSDALNSK